MKAKKFTIFLAFLVVSVLGLAVSIYFYNKPHVDVKKSPAAYVLSAQNLIKEYRQNEVDTNAKYTESVIQVQGKIFEVSTLKGNGVITIKDNDNESSIICHMLPEENRKIIRLRKGQDVVVKGICTGYLLDVMMVKCTLVE